MLAEQHFRMLAPQGEILERAKGIEPSYRAWEALVLPLNYARIEVRKGL